MMSLKYADKKYAMPAEARAIQDSDLKTASKRAMRIDAEKESKKENWKWSLIKDIFTPEKKDFYHIAQSMSLIASTLSMFALAAEFLASKIVPPFAGFLDSNPIYVASAVAALLVSSASLFISEHIIKKKEKKESGQTNSK